MKYYRTNNFTLEEVVHSDFKSFPEELLPIAYCAMERVQSLRDVLNLPITITSGYRSAGYNATLKGAAPNSHHIWRYEGDRMLWAMDIISPKLSAPELYERVRKLVVGETYLHKALQFVHFSPQAQDEEWVA